MSRRKGERPVIKQLDTWASSHPVAHAIQTGSYWFDAWLGQKATPIASLSRLTGIPAARLMGIAYGDRISRAELDALARAWMISADDLATSIGKATLIVD